MKRFVLKCLLYFTPFIGIIFLTGFLADGYTDPFYLRFTTPRQSSLILGTSRSAQGIVPEIINEKLLSLNVDPLYNFSFTIAHSPYGPTYNRAVNKKLSVNKGNGIFILAVDPWSIGSRVRDENGGIIYTEKETFLEKLELFNSKPNFDYLVRCYNGPFLNLLMNKIQDSNTDTKVREDGWLEVTPKNMSKIQVTNRIKNKVINYREDHLKNYRLSDERLNSLSVLIGALKKNGKVFLVRIPVNVAIRNIEDEALFQFDSIILDLANQHEIPYFNFYACSDEYDYTDGNHLFKESSKDFSNRLGDSILISLNK